MKQLGMRGILCSPFEMSLSGLPLTFYGLKGPSDWHRSARSDVAMFVVYQFENRCSIYHLIKSTAIYKSGVEYEQGMRKRPPSKFGVALVQEYRKRGLTQYSLAQKLGRSTRYLNNLEHDRNEPRFTTILLLADA